MGGAPYRSEKEGVGASLLSVSAFNHERAPMSHLQLLSVIEANNLINNNVQTEPLVALKSSHDDTTL